MIGLNDILTFQKLPGPLRAFTSRDADIVFNFSVLIDGDTFGDFMAVEALQKTIEAHEYRELGKNDAPHELIGQGANGRVVLKWGLMNRGALWEWMESVKIGGEFRKDVIIMQLTRGKVPVRAFNLVGAFPVRWNSANLDAGTSDTAVEEVELSYQSLEVNIVPLPF